jgi:DNA repair exonuclease SbcCD ATPase subunit
LIAGPTGSGKSTILDAIRLAALRYVPALGKTEAATSALMSGRELEVEIGLPAARGIRQKLTKTGKGLSWSTSCSWLGSEARDSEQAQEALRLFGEDAATVAEGLDGRELFNLPGPQRAARIERLVAAEENQEEQLKRLGVLVLQELVAVALRADRDKLPDDADRLRGSVPGWSKEDNHTGQYASLLTVWSMFKAKLLDAGLTVASGWINEEKRAAALDKLKKERARDELRLRLQEIAEPDEDEIARLEERRASIEQQIGAAGERASELVSTRQKIEKAETDLARAKREAAAAQTAREACERDVSRRDALQREIVKLEQVDAIAKAETALTEARRNRKVAAAARGDYESDAVKAEELRERRHGANRGRQTGGVLRGLVGRGAISQRIAGGAGPGS